MDYGRWIESTTRSATAKSLFWSSRRSLMHDIQHRSNLQVSQRSVRPLHCAFMSKPASDVSISWSFLTVALFDIGMDSVGCQGIVFTSVALVDSEATALENRLT